MLGLSNITVTAPSVYRCLLRNNLNKKPIEAKPPYQKFMEYELGFLHIDEPYLPKTQGQRKYFFWLSIELQDCCSIQSTMTRPLTIHSISYLFVNLSFPLQSLKYSPITEKSSLSNYIRGEIMQKRIKWENWILTPERLKLTEW